MTERLHRAGVSHYPGKLVQALRPTLATSYQRTTVHLPTAQSRFTLDTALTWRDLLGYNPQPLQAGEITVVETKSPATPSEADRHLWAAGHRPDRVSKYATGMALMHLTPPANKWHRLLSRELQEAAAEIRMAGAA